MREHTGTTIVVKVGGSVMEDPGLLAPFAEDLSLLRMVGIRPVVVHGGGPQISDLSRRLGIEPVFVDGLRVTDASTLEVARMVLAGKVTEELVAGLNAGGVPAVGLSGGDGRLLLARRRADGDGPDLGFVGEIEEVNVALLEHLIDVAVPVIASMAVDRSGQAYNVNADLAAAQVAVALRAHKLLLLTDVPGVLRDGELVPELSPLECRDLVASGGADGGMVPKLEAAVAAVEGGVPRAHVVDGRLPHATILELFTPEGAGTMVAAPVDEPVGEEVAAP
ncbi:MAG: acetylglutamate kinase [Actinobacteria bacterium]|nr:acetylglutamate kinase [Actinomycetota bacterium]